MAPAAARRAQADRPPLRLRAAARRRRQPRHRRAGGRRRGRRRGAGARPPDADRRTRRDRRHAAGRSRLRRRGQHAGALAPEPAVRLLRRRRARPGVPRHGRGRSARQRQRQPLRPAPGRRGRLHQHQPERAQAGVRGHLHRGRAEVAIEDGRVRIAAEGRQRKFVESVQQVTFSGSLAADKGQQVLYVTERCVFCAAAARACASSRWRRASTSSATSSAQMAFRPIVADSAS